MHTFYYPNHKRHDPARLQKADAPPEEERFIEVAQRGEIILQAVKAAGLGPVIPPGDFDIESIGEIHEYGMLNLLQHGNRLINDKGLEQPVSANTFSLKTNPSHIPRSILGLLGYYSFDTTSPLLEHTWDAAYWAVQTAISASALVMAGMERIAYALCRPPGHHASNNYFGGYCYLNNAAIAANWLVQQGQRVAIVDIDYHHGNGTQEIFYGRSDVLVCSIHADPFNEFPYFWGYADEYGEETGRNYNFNFPLQRQADEGAYLRTLDQALSKVRLFVPDILLISFGADIIQNDPIGGFRLQTDSLTRIGARFHALGLPLVVIQEGGYRLDTLGECVVAFLRGAMGM